MPLKFLFLSCVFLTVSVASAKTDYSQCVRIFTPQKIVLPNPAYKEPGLLALKPEDRFHPNKTGRPEILRRLPKDFPESDKSIVVDIAKITPEVFVKIENRGMFPWREGEGGLTINSPEKRGVLRIDKFTNKSNSPDKENVNHNSFTGGLYIPENHARFLKQNVQRADKAGEFPRYQMSINRAFDEVIYEAQNMNRWIAKDPGQQRPGQSRQWLTDEIVNVYKEMHRNHMTHSLEVWDSWTGELVAGIIFTTPNGYVAGETMFHRKVVVDGVIVREVGEVAKMATLGLALYLRDLGYTWMDVQTVTRGTAQYQFGAQYVEREAFLDMIKKEQVDPKAFVPPKHTEKMDDFFTIYFEQKTDGNADVTRPILIGITNPNGDAKR